jgi:hypothetical protein
LEGFSPFYFSHSTQNSSTFSIFVLDFFFRVCTTAASGWLGIDGNFVLKGQEKKVAIEKFRPIPVVSQILPVLFNLQVIMPPVFSLTVCC